MMQPITVGFRSRWTKLAVSRVQSAVDDLNERLGGFAGNRKYLIDAQERIADSLERQAIAIERILARLNVR